MTSRSTLKHGGVVTEKKTLEQVERWARARGIKRIELNVFAHNKAGLALYRMCGLDPHEMTLGKRVD